MSMNGKSEPTFPEYGSHDEVRCKSCGRSLGHVQAQAYGFTKAGWMKVCIPCHAVSWYSIVQREKVWSPY